MELSRRDARFRSPRRSGRFRRGALVAKVAWTLARGNGGLAGLGLLHAVLTILLSALASRADGVAFRLLAFFPLSFATALTAVAACLVAAEALAGRSCGAGEAFAAARSRRRSIAVFAFVSGAVTLALGAGEGLGAPASQGTVFALGLLWGLAMMFAAPMIALEGSGGLRAVARSVVTFGHRWLEALGGALAIGGCAFVALLPLALVIPLDPPLVFGLAVFVAWGIVITLAQATWITFAVVLQRDASGAVVAEIPLAPPSPFWRNPLQRRAWIAWSTAILVVVVFVGGFVAARRAEDRRHKYDVETPAWAAPNVIEFPLSSKEAIHEGTGIYWFREAAGTVRASWVRGDVLLVEVLLEPRFIPQAEAGGFQVHEEDGSSWISIIPTGLT